MDDMMKMANITEVFLQQDMCFLATRQPDASYRLRDSECARSCVGFKYESRRLCNESYGACTEGYGISNHGILYMAMSVAMCTE